MRGQVSVETLASDGAFTRCLKESADVKEASHWPRWGSWKSKARALNPGKLTSLPSSLVMSSLYLISVINQGLQDWNFQITDLDRPAGSVLSLLPFSGPSLFSSDVSVALFSFSESMTAWRL